MLEKVKPSALAMFFISVWTGKSYYLTYDCERVCPRD